MITGFLQNINSPSLLKLQFHSTRKSGFSGEIISAIILQFLGFRRLFPSSNLKHKILIEKRSQYLHILLKLMLF